MLENDGRIRSGLKANGFDWGGVNVAIETGVGSREDQGENPIDFIISLRLNVKNEDGKKCPYFLDVEAVALLQVSDSLPTERREDLAEVNGLAIVYGALRELVVSLTARMEYGTLVLPGVNFQDHAKMRDGAAKMAGSVPKPPDSLVVELANTVPKSEDKG